MAPHSPTTNVPSGVRVLVLERDERLRAQVSQLLTLAGHEVGTATLLTEAQEQVRVGRWDVVVAHLGVVGVPGIASLAAVPSPAGAVPVIAAIPPGPTRPADALRAGAGAWVAHPYDSDELLQVLEGVAREVLRARELASLRTLLGGNAESVLVGRSPAMQRLRELVQRAAASPGTVVVRGEPGTGKELVARTIHALSPRARAHCVVVECAGRDAASLEAELFGEEEGPRSPAAGAVARASGGTLVIDDVAAMPPSLQDRLARLLRERALGHAGGGAGFRLVLVVHDRRGGALEAPPTSPLLAVGGVLIIAVPPLRERRSDIPLLASHFRARIAHDAGVEVPRLAPETVSSLLEQEWPGNVRQLEHHVGRAMLMASGSPTAALAAASSPARDTPPQLIAVATAAQWTLDELERAYILRVLDEERGHQSNAAQRLGIDRRTLYRKLKQYRAEDARSGERPVARPERCTTG